MKNYLSFLLLTILLSVGYITSVVASTDDHVAIELVNKHFSKAFARSDVDGMADTYTVDAQILPPGSETLKGKEVIREFWAGALEYAATVEMKTVELEVFGGTATEVGEYTMKNAEGGILETGKLLVIWRKVDGQWKWHRDIWNVTTTSE